MKTVRNKSQKETEQEKQGTKLRGERILAKKEVICKELPLSDPERITEYARNLD